MSPTLARARLIVQSPATLLTLLCAVALPVVGVLAIHTVDPLFALRQVQWFVAGLILVVLLTLPSSRDIGAATYPLFLLSLLALAVLLLPFVPRAIVPVRNTATSWFDLGFMTVQPSEFVKVLFVLAVARFFRFRQMQRTWWGMLVPFGIMCVPVMLILKQPDLGTAMVFGPALVAMMLAAGSRLRHLATVLGVTAAAAALVVGVSLSDLPDSMQLLRKHQRQRIVAMVSQATGDLRYVNDIGFQQDKAVTLVGAGGVFGYGEEASERLIKLNGLPERHNDMIFVVVVNRWGLAGGLMVLGLFTVMVASMLAVAGRTKDPFARLACVGFAAMLFFQMAVNVAMTLGLMPITGITLPLISYGGSSMLATFIKVALVVNFGSTPQAIIARPSFEFDSPSEALE